MDQFPGNSNRARSRSEPQKIESVTTARRSGKKKKLGHQFRDSFISGSARGSAEYVIIAIVIPAMRDLLAETARGGIDRWIYGGDGPSRPRRFGGLTGYSDGPQVDYQSRYSNSRPSRSHEPNMLSRRSRGRDVSSDLVIATREEANDVIDRMFDILNRYGSVSVSNLCALTGVESSHTDTKWGWVQLRGARAIPLSGGGFLLHLPEPEPLG